jgi:hypothetical protein
VLPDPDDVDSATSFAVFVAGLRASLDAALAVPLANEWIDVRDDGWVNWTLGSYIEGMAAWLKPMGRVPLSRDRHAIWDVLIPTTGAWEFERDTYLMNVPGGESELRSYLANVEAWARSADPSTSEPWHAAAETMAAGVMYE